MLTVPVLPMTRTLRSVDELRELIAPEPASVKVLLAWLYQHPIINHTMAATGDMLAVWLPVSSAQALLNTEFHVFTHEESSVLRDQGQTRDDSLNPDASLSSQGNRASHQQQQQQQTSGTQHQRRKAVSIIRSVDGHALVPEHIAALIDVIGGVSSFPRRKPAGPRAFRSSPTDQRHSQASGTESSQNGASYIAYGVGGDRMVSLQVVPICQNGQPTYRTDQLCADNPPMISSFTVHVQETFPFWGTSSSVSVPTSTPKPFQCITNSEFNNQTTCFIAIGGSGLGSNLENYHG